MIMNDWAKEIHENSCAHGWWDEERSFGDIVALCHSELSEALEEYRNGRKTEYFDCKLGDYCWGCGDFRDPEHCSYKGDKPEGIAVEMIDCMIRILDWCGKEGIDVDRLLKEKHEYNKTRPYRHGGKAL